MTPHPLGGESAPEPCSPRVGDGDSASAAMVSHLEPMALTLGRGVHRPRGLRVFFMPQPDAPSGFERLLNRLPGREEEGWLSLNTFNGDCRNGAAWESACGVGVDLDYLDAEGSHAALPRQVEDVVLGAATLGRVPGHLIHPTPRGFRVFRVFACQVAARSVRDRAAVALAGEVEEALQSLHVAATGGLTSGRPRNGLLVDRGALDAARLFFRPSCIVRGVRRNSRVVRTPETPTGADGDGIGGNVHA